MNYKSLLVILSCFYALQASAMEQNNNNNNNHVQYPLSLRMQAARVVANQDYNIDELPLEIQKNIQAWRNVDSKNNNNSTANNQSLQSRLLFTAIEQHAFPETIHDIIMSNPFIIESRNKETLTPMLCAAKSGNRAGLQLLLNKKANLYAHDNYGMNALMHAVAQGHMQTMLFLLSQFKSFINTSDKRRFTPLIHAAKNGHKNIVAALLHYGANIDDEDNFGMTPLMHAAQRGNLDVCRLLVNHGANINMIDRTNSSAIIHALLHEKFDVIQLLKENGSQLEKSDAITLNRALRFVSRHGHINAAKLLLQQPNIDINSQGEDDNTALLLATKSGHHDIVQLLLNQPNIDAHVINTNNNNALNLAIANKDILMIQLLLAHNIKISDGKTVVENLVKHFSDDTQISMTLWHNLLDNASDQRVNYIADKYKKNPAVLRVILARRNSEEIWNQCFRDVISTGSTDTLKILFECNLAPNEKVLTNALNCLFENDTTGSGLYTKEHLERIKKVELIMSHCKSCPLVHKYNHFVSKYFAQLFVIFGGMLLHTLVNNPK